MARILGLDIGKRSVRGALVKTALRRIDVLRYVEIPIAAPVASTPPPDGEAVEVPLADPIRDAVRGVLGSLEDPPDRVVTALDGREASLRVVELPQGAAKRIADVLPYELETLIPFAADEAVIDHQPIGILAGQLRLLACAAPRQRVAAHLQRMRELEIDPREIAVGAATLDGLVPLLPMLSSPGPVMLIQIDEDSTDLCVLADGRCELARSLSVGIAQADGGELEAALGRTLTSYRAAGGTLPAEAFLLGDAASDPHALGWLSGRFGFDVRALPLPPAEGTEELDLARFGRATAMACRLAGNSKRIDLRRGEFASARTMGAIRKQARLIAVCAAAVLLAFLFSTWARWVTMDDEREMLRAELDRVTEDAFGNGTTSASRARRLLDQGTRTDDPLPRFDAYDVLDAVNGGIPAEITHSTRRLHIELDDDGHGGRFELQGIVATVAERDRIAQELTGHRCIQEIENGRTHPGPGGQGLNYELEGTVRCPGAPEPDDRRRRQRRSSR